MDTISIETRRTRQILNICIVALLSMILAVALSPLRGGYLIIPFMNGGSICNAGMLICFFIATVKMIRWKESVLPSSAILVCILIGSCILELPGYIIHWDSTAPSALSVVARIVGAIFGYLYVTRNSYKKIILAVFILLSLVITFVISDWWCNLICPDIPNYHFTLWGEKIYH